MTSPQPPQERGASSVEYGLLIAGIAAVVAVAVFLLGGVTREMSIRNCETISSGMRASATCS